MKKNNSKNDNNNKNKIIIVSAIILLIIIAIIINILGINTPSVEYYRYETSNPAGTYFIREIEIKKDKTMNYVFGEATNPEYSDLKTIIEYTGKYIKNQNNSLIFYTAILESTDKKCEDGEYKCKETFTFQKNKGDNHLYLILEASAPEYSKIEKPILINKKP